MRGHLMWVTDVKGVPEFWLTAMKNSVVLQETVRPS